LVTLVTAVAALAACSTTVDPDIAVRDTSLATTTTLFIASGSNAELLDELLEEASRLSEAVVANEGQHDIIARIDTIWEAARPGVEYAVPGRLPAFDRAIAMLHTAVDRRRPADADKAYTNLQNLTAAALPPST
jgi:hypothetical protein